MTTKFLRLNDVLALTGLSRSSIYHLMKTREFPASVPLGRKAVGWVQEEIDGWVQARIRLRQAALEALSRE